MFRSFKYRIWTDENSERELAIAVETHRRLYNECLSYKQMAWQCCGVTVTYFDMCRWFPQAQDKCPYLQRLNVQSARETMRRLDRAFDNFFIRVKNGEQPGYPKFKGKDCFSSFTFQQSGWKVIGSRLRLQHIGTIRINLHRPMEGKIKTVTIKREAGKWYVIFCCDLGDVAVPKSMKPSIGVDFGLESFLTTSDGESVPNPRFLKAELPRLRQVQRSVSRKKKGGKNRRKAIKRLAKVHARIRNQRMETHHQVARSLVRRYGLVAVESLTVSNMVKNHRLAQAISDAGWFGFISILHHQASKAGVQVVEVDPQYTSQQCSRCGQEVKKDLSVRWHDCPHCGLSLHRDHNAALNILARGLARIGPSGLNVTPESKRAPRSLKPKRLKV